jgi:Flp pilus assembly protein TadG
MVIRKSKPSRRLGAAAVETAVVMIPAVMFLFGVFEYGRLLLDWNVLNNASREGCRLALVSNTSPTISTDIQTLVTAKMGPELASFNSFTVTVSGIHVDPVSGVSTTYQGNNVNNLAAGDLITVTVSGKYKFMNIIPFNPMPPLTINSAVTMVCEGAT